MPKKRVKKQVKKVSNKKISKNRFGSRLSTGIPNFDKLIEGGFKSSSTNILVGSSGSGKTILATQFLIEGLKNKEHCLYVTFEEKKDRFYQDMLRFGWNLEEYEKKGLFMFLEYTPAKVNTMLEEGGGAIENIILDKKVTRLVIDSITSFALLFENELEKREASLSLFNMISEWNCTSVLTVEEDPLEGEEAAKSIEFESDSIILLYYTRKKAERERYLEVLKMRGTKHSKSVFLFEIGSKGISLSNSPVKTNLLKTS